MGHTVSTSINIIKIRTSYLLSIFNVSSHCFLTTDIIMTLLQRVWIHILLKQQSNDNKLKVHMVTIVLFNIFFAFSSMRILQILTRLHRICARFMLLTIYDLISAGGWAWQNLGGKVCFVYFCQIIISCSKSRSGSFCDPYNMSHTIQTDLTMH